MEEKTVSGDLVCRKRYQRGASQDEEIESCGDGPINRRVWKHDEDTGKDRVFSYSYPDDVGRLDDGTVRTEQLSGGGTVVTTTDAKGRILEEVRDFSAAYHRETHKYDESGREIEKAEWDSDGTIINRRTYVYVNDPQGNWIRRTELFWSRPTPLPLRAKSRSAVSITTNPSKSNG